VYTSLSHIHKRFLFLMFFCSFSAGLGSCSDAVGDIKELFARDLFGAVGFKPGADPVIAPNETSCGLAAAGGASATSPSGGRCLTAAEAANAIVRQCADCKVVLTFKGTSDSSLCGSIAVTSSKLLYGVGTGSSVISAQDAAMAACKTAEGVVSPSTCALAKTRCL